MRLRIAVAVALVLVSLGCGTHPAGAEAQNGSGHAGGAVDGRGGRVVVEVPGSDQPGFPGAGSTGGRGSAARIDCRYFAPSVNAGSKVPSVGSPIGDVAGVETGSYVWLICRDVSTGEITYQNLFVWDPANPPPLTPSAATLAQTAANSMQLPLPGVQTWPPTTGRGLVNLPVWLHVDNWETLTASASAGALTATVEAVPVRAVWDMDEGSVTCTDAGPVYDPAARPDPASSSCSYTYRRSSGIRADRAFHDTATVAWHLRWYATNGQGGDLGELSSPTAGFDLQIEESQALVAPRGG